MRQRTEPELSLLGSGEDEQNDEDDGDDPGGPVIYVYDRHNLSSNINTAKYRREICYLHC